MTQYTVTYIDATGGEVSTFVEADDVQKDPHWVTFSQSEAVAVYAPVEAGCACGGSFNRVRPSGLSKKRVVAIFPAHRIRRVEKSIDADV